MERRVVVSEFSEAQIEEAIAKLVEQSEAVNAQLASVAKK